MTTWIPSPDFDPRSELLPNIFDHYAWVKPDAIYAEYPVDPMTYEKGYRPITYKAFANAINGVAGWLTKTLGPGTGETLAYLGPNDLRYPALVLGAVKAGYCVGWSFHVVRFSGSLADMVALTDVSYLAAQQCSGPPVAIYQT